MSDQAFPRKEPPPVSTLGWGDYDTVLDVMAAGVKRGPYLMGDRFTAADLYIASHLRFGMQFGMIDKRPVFTAASERAAARPAFERASTIEARERAKL